MISSDLIIGSAIGIAGIILAIYTHIVKIKGRLVYWEKSLKLIGKNEYLIPDEVTILFDGKKVETLSKTIIIFWNSGKEIIRGGDIVPSHEPRIFFDKDIKVLSAKVVKCTEKTNEFNVKINHELPNEAICTFNYLEPKDGAVIELMHTSKDLSSPNIKGKIKGVPKGILNYGYFTFLRKKCRISEETRKLFWFFLFGSLIMLLVGVLFYTKYEELLQISAMVIILSLIYGIPSVYVLWATWNHYPPKKLYINEIKQYSSIFK